MNLNKLRFLLMGIIITVLSVVLLLVKYNAAEYGLLAAGIVLFIIGLIYNPKPKTPSSDTESK